MYNQSKCNQFSISQDSTVGAAQTITKVAVVGGSHFVTELDVSIETGGAGKANVTLQDGAGTPVVYWKGVIDTMSVGEKVKKSFDPPLQFPTGEKVDLIIGGVATVVTRANLKGYTVRG